MKKLILALTCLFLAIPCRARTITVDDDGPADFNNIQAAIDDSNDGDTIIVADGIFKGVGNRDIDFLGKAITLRSANGPKSCIIDCEGTYEDNHRGFYFHSGEDENSILDGFAITNAYIVVMCEAGAGIRIDNSSPTIRNCIITNNVAELDPLSLCFCYGGGIYFNGTTLIMTNCIISDNWVGGWGLGGGICCMSGSNTMIRNCIINNNTATTSALGGGIYLDYYANSLYMVNCTIAENTASSDGGGIYFEQYENPPSITIRNSILWDNSPNQISTCGTYKGLVSCCDVQGGWPGPGPGGKPPNMDENPFFADPENDDYHLKSQAGRWNPNQNEWVTDANTSPCIDSGHPTDDWTAELWPHGKRINMGAYGGTPQASMSPLIDLGYIADLNNDDKVDTSDLKLFTKEWQNEQLLLSEDLDRNGFVDFNDYAIFGLQWSYPSALGPGITYRIEKCDPNSFHSLATEQVIETRFSVTVKGLYIHFKDMMVANCCTEELGLEMTVEDNLITIYEIEYIPGVCFCICDYPVTAALGPFEPGTCILEVYEDWGGFIGSTSVVIDPPQ
jgi:hypothetical protein